MSAEHHVCTDPCGECGGGCDIGHAPTCERSHATDPEHRHSFFGTPPACLLCHKPQTIADVLDEIESLNDSYGETEWAKGVKGGHSFAVARIRDFLGSAPVDRVGGEGLRDAAVKAANGEQPMVVNGSQVLLPCGWGDVRNDGGRLCPIINVEDPAVAQFIVASLRAALVNDETADTASPVEPDAKCPECHGLGFWTADRTGETFDCAICGGSGAASPVEVVEPRGTMYVGNTAWCHRTEPHDHHAPTIEHRTAIDREAHPGTDTTIRCGKCKTAISWHDGTTEARPAPAPSEDVVTPTIDEHTVPPHMLPEEIIGLDRKDGDGLLAALWWALDMIEQYDQHLIDHGDDPAQVRSAVHQRGLAKAHGALDAARLTLAGTRESGDINARSLIAPDDPVSARMRAERDAFLAEHDLTRNSGEEPR